MKRTLAQALALFACLSAFAGSPAKPIVLDKCPDTKVTLKSGTDKGDGVYQLHGQASVRFNGSFNLTDYKSVKYTITNENPKDYLGVACLLGDSKCPADPIVPKGRDELGMCKIVRLAPGETRTVVFNLPPEILHPDVVKRYHESLHLRNNVYSNILDMITFSADAKDIRVIKFVTYDSLNDGAWTLSDIKIIPGKKAVPEAMKLTKEQFYPMIDKYGQFKHKEWLNKVHSDKDLAKAKAVEDKDLASHAGPSDWSKFGGWKNGPRYEATGSFRVEKIDGKWWMIDPEGYLYWAHGIVRVAPSCACTPLDDRHDFFEGLPTDPDDPLYQFYFTNDELLGPYYTARGEKETYDFSRANLYRKYGEDFYQIYAERCHQRLRSWGVNLIANSSDRAICLMDKTPYNDRVDLGAPVEGFPAWPELKGSGGWWRFIDPFDELFETCVWSHLMDKIEQLRDPWCIGMFVDNEIGWGDVCKYGILSYKSEPGAACKLVFMNYLTKKYKTIAAFNKSWGSHFADWNAFLQNTDDIPGANKTDLEEMAKMMTRKYFETTRRVFKEVAPDKLYMGCRFAGSNKNVVQIGSEYCDVMSWNAYRFSLEGFKPGDGIDKPVMIGEFHFGALDRGMLNHSLKYTENQRQRATAYEIYLKSALENPYLIGTNWHQFSDQAASGRFDGECLQVGFTDCCDTPYYESIQALRNIGYHMYEIRSNSALKAE